MAAILKNLTGAPVGSERADQLTKLAARIGENRVVAGLHYPEDIAAGSALGTRLADHFIAQSQVAGSALEWLWTKAKAEW